MSVTGAAQTSQFPRHREKKFALAPQTVEDTAAATGFTYLHYVDYNPSRTQDVNTAEEYGDTDVSADPTQVDFGDINVSGPLQTRLCLNEIGYHLAHLMGAPVTTGPDGDSNYTHVFTSGKLQLPYATIQDTDSQAARTAHDIAYNGLTLAIARGGGVQICDFDFVAKNIILPDTEVTGGDVTAGPSRAFVEKNQWRVLLDAVQLGRLLSFNWAYATDILDDRYVEDRDDASALYVGDPSLSIGCELRHVTEAQRAAIGGLGVVHDFQLIGDGPDNQSITFDMPRIQGPVVFPEKDDKLQKLSFNGIGSRVTGGSPEPMITVTLVNKVASY